MEKVKVFAKEGQQLMPTTIERANDLIMKGEAKLKDTSPMSIILLKNSKRYLQTTELENNLKISDNLSTDYRTINLGKGLSLENDEIHYISWNLSKSINTENLQSHDFLVIGNKEEDRFNIICEVASHVSNNSKDINMVVCSVNPLDTISLIGVKGICGFSKTIKESADYICTIQKEMMDRFAFMEKNQINNIQNFEGYCDYYDFFGRSYQYNDFIEVVYKLTEEEFGRDYKQLLIEHPSGTITKIMTIEKIYHNLSCGKECFYELKTPIRGYSKYLKLSDISKTSKKYRPKQLILCIDNLQEIMFSSDYKSVEKVRDALGSIARLGRAAGCNLLLNIARMSAGSVPSDLFNNIQMCSIIGGIDGANSKLIFEEDISDRCKPDINLRGFIQYGKRYIYEVQYFEVDKYKDLIFDEDLLSTQYNKVYLDNHRVDLRDFIFNESEPQVSTVSVDIEKDEPKKDSKDNIEDVCIETDSDDLTVKVSYNELYSLFEYLYEENEHLSNKIQEVLENLKNLKQS